jgi:hypothetical protein
MKYYALIINESYNHHRKDLCGPFDDKERLDQFIMNQLNNEINLNNITQLISESEIKFPT